MDRKKINAAIYNSRWRALRKRHLAKYPLCALCEKQGRVTPATVVHHVTAHKGDRRLAYDVNNFESLCAPHHDRDMQREEWAEQAGDGSVMCDEDGFPIGREW